MATASRGVRCLRPAPRAPLISRCHGLRSFTVTQARYVAPKIEEKVRAVREEYGHLLPPGLWSKESQEYKTYYKFYGEPIWRETEKAEEETPPPVEIFYGEDDPRSGDLVEAVAGDVPMNKRQVRKAQKEERRAARRERDEKRRAEKEAAVSGARERGEITAEEEEHAMMQIQKDMQKAFDAAEIVAEEQDDAADKEEESEEADEEDDFGRRTHPLTEMGKWGTFPSTVLLPESMQLLSKALLAEVSNTHLDEGAMRTLGPGLEKSPVATSRSVRSYANIQLNTLHPNMTNMEANLFVATVLPGYYSQSLSALTELRKRLGGDWVVGDTRSGEGGVKRVLDIGSGGAGILAWRSIFAAEQKRRAEDPVQYPALSEAEAEKSADGHKATVVISTDLLRMRMTHFLDNTTFLPRIPDATGAGATVADVLNVQQPRKYNDLVIATNTLLAQWDVNKRKNHVQNLWSLVNPEGGVLLLIEKGVPSGFEAIAAARDSLLRWNIATTEGEKVPLTENLDQDEPRASKEVASIIAPCTNHDRCPLFRGGATTSGRKDYCRFPQRYERPGYLQRIMGAKNTNFEDLEFSYVAVRRGYNTATDIEPIDPEIEEFDRNARPPWSPYSMKQLRAHAYTLPRIIYRPLKQQRGHNILDVCTPSAEIQRWTVPRSYGKTAYRDARKSSWGDLWALGAKTKIARNIKLGKRGGVAPRKKIIRVHDQGGDELEEITREVDRKGGKKKNPGKRQRERREAKRLLRNKRASTTVVGAVAAPAPSAAM